MNPRAPREKSATASQEEHKIRSELGRIRARVSQLEQELAKARTQQQPQVYTHNPYAPVETHQIRTGPARSDKARTLPNHGGHIDACSTTTTGTRDGSLGGCVNAQQEGQSVCPLPDLDSQSPNGTDRIRSHAVHIGNKDKGEFEANLLRQPACPHRPPDTTTDVQARTAQASERRTNRAGGPSDVERRGSSDATPTHTPSSGVVPDVEDGIEVRRDRAPDATAVHSGEQQRHSQLRGGPTRRRAPTNRSASNSTSR